MCSRHLLLPQLLVFLCRATTGSSSLSSRTLGTRSNRTVMAWANGNPQAAFQLRNSTWSGIFDGVQAFCGATFKPDGSGIEVNQSEWQGCSALVEACRHTGMKFYLVVGGKVPDAAILNPQPVVSASIQLASKYNLDGFSLDDEYDCAPRSTLDRFRDWIAFVDSFAQGLRSAGLHLSAAVQAMFGIQDVPYHPHCGPHETPAECSQACKDLPSRYPLEPEVTRLMSQSQLDRFLVMDTYYFTTGRFLNALDWYVGNVSRDKLGLAMMNRDDLTDDGLLARFYAIDKSGVDWINIFLLPADEMFLLFLQRWKSNCVGCGVQSILGCYDLDVACNIKHTAVELS